MSSIIKLKSSLGHRKVGEDERFKIVAERKKRKKKKKHAKQVKQVAVAQASSGDFPFDTIHGYELKTMEYRVPPMGERKKLRSRFKEFKGSFLKHIGEKFEPELRALGMNDEEIKRVKAGHGVNGYNVHHKLPIHGGGKNEFSNLVLMPIPPHDDLHHVVMDKQIRGMKEGEARMIKVPWTDEMVYVAPQNKQEFDKSKDYEGKGGKRYGFDGKINSIKRKEDDKKVQAFKQALTATKMNRR